MKQLEEKRRRNSRIQADQKEECLQNNKKHKLQHNLMSMLNKLLDTSRKRFCELLTEVFSPGLLAIRSQRNTQRPAFL